MRPFYVLILISIFSYDISFGQDNNKEQDSTSQIDKTIFVYGCCHDGIFLRYLIGLTHKTNPKICFLPTAAADDERTISFWNSICSNLNLESCVIKTFISSSTEKRSFEEVILSSDAIVVDGGNTLNMLGIWKVQGIDTLLRKAYDRGIILSGGSAGSLCWFKQGYSDSRPKELTIIDGLGFLDYSHSPHYHNQYSTERRPRFLKAITDGKLQAGYACDDLAGLVFVNGVMKKSVSQDESNNNYFVYFKDGELHEELLPAEIIK